MGQEQGGEPEDGHNEGGRPDREAQDEPEDDQHGDVRRQRRADGPTEKVTAATTMRLCLPSLSKRSPALPASTVAKRIELTTKPSRKGVSQSSSMMNKIAPEITPVS